MSTDLLWGLVRKNNSFLVKDRHHGGASFAKEANNLTGKSSSKHSGLVNQATASVVATADGVNVGIALRGKSFKPKAAQAIVTIKYKAGPRKAASAAKAALKHAPALKKAAAAKVVKLLHASRVTGGVIKAKARRGQVAKRA